MAQLLAQTLKGKVAIVTGPVSPSQHTSCSDNSQAPPEALGQLWQLTSLNEGQTYACLDT